MILPLSSTSFLLVALITFQPGTLLRVNFNSPVYETLSLDSRKILFPSLVYACQEIFPQLPLVLGRKEEGRHPSPFLNDFLTSILTYQQALELVDCFKDSQNFHPLVLPFSFVDNNINIIKALAPYLSKYNPGVIKLSSSSRKPLNFSLEQMRMVLTILGPHPEYCGDLAVFDLVKSFKYRNDWRLAGDLTSPFWKLERDTVIFKAIGNLYETTLNSYSLQVPKPPPPSIITTTIGHLQWDSEAVCYNALEMLANGRDMMANYYFLLERLEDLGGGNLLPARQAMWHGFLLLLTMWTISNCMGKIFISDLEWLQVKPAIEDFFLRHSVESVPPFLIQGQTGLLGWLKRYGFYIQADRSNKRFAQNLGKLGELYPSYWAQLKIKDDCNYIVTTAISQRLFKYSLDLLEDWSLKLFSLVIFSCFLKIYIWLWSFIVT